MRYQATCCLRPYRFPYRSPDSHLPERSRRGTLSGTSPFLQPRALRASPLTIRPTRSSNALEQVSEQFPVPIFRLRTANSIPLAIWPFLTAFLTIAAVSVTAHEPKPETLAAFERYRTLTEARMEADRRDGHFLYFDRYPAERRTEIDAQLRRGEFVFEQLHTQDRDNRIPVPGGLIHHWLGAAFLPGATLAKTKAVLEDYAEQKVIYFPDVRQSKLISENGENRDVFLQFYSKTVVTAVFNVNFASLATDYSPTQTQVRACSTRVADVEDFGKPEERELPPADSHGYLWKLCTWWHIEERAAGTYVQVEAIELSRTVPFMFAWIVNPIIRNVPKEFLSHLLNDTRKAITGKDSAPQSVSWFREQPPADDHSQPSSAICSSRCRASGLPFLDAATSSTCAWSQFFSTPSPRRYKSARVTSAGT